MREVHSPNNALVYLPLRDDELIDKEALLIV